MLKGKLKEKVSDPNAVAERQGKKVISERYSGKNGSNHFATFVFMRQVLR